MRELIGKIPTKNSSITEVVYLSEMVRCLECQQTMPMGIEIVTVKKNRRNQTGYAPPVLLPRARL
jgi:hypothetical protein